MIMWSYERYTSSSRLHIIQKLTFPIILVWHGNHYKGFSRSLLLDLYLVYYTWTISLINEQAYMYVDQRASLHVHHTVNVQLHCFRSDQICESLNLSTTLSGFQEFKKWKQSDGNLSKFNELFSHCIFLPLIFCNVLCNMWSLVVLYNMKEVPEAAKFTQNDSVMYDDIGCSMRSSERDTQ